MCNIERIDPRILSMWANLIGMAMEASSREQEPSDDVLGAARGAYQQGKITKAQYFAVIDALDESTTVRTTATSEPSWNREYLSANAYLNQFRGR